MPAEFRRRMRALFDFDSPETAALTSEEWFGTANALCLEHGLRRDMVAAMVAEAHVEGRPGLESLLDTCAACGVPLLVVSAGFSDMIEAFLESLRPGLVFLGETAAGGGGGRTREVGTVRVSANKMVFEGEELVGWLPARDGPCTSRNKQLTSSRERAFFEDHLQERSHWLVLGDRPGDTMVAAGCPAALAPSQELRVGFFAGAACEWGHAGAEYAAAFDLVLPAAAETGLFPMAEMIRP